MKSVIVACTLAALVGPLPAQGTPGLPVDAPLEVVLQRAREVLRTLRKDFDDVLKKAEPVLSWSGNANEEERRRAAETLAPWVGAFPEVFTQRLAAAKSAALKRNLVQVLADSGEPAVAPLLAELIGTQGEELDALIVECLGLLGNPDVGDRLLLLATQPPSPAVEAAALVALARLGHPLVQERAAEALGGAEVVVRSGAARALGIVAPENRDAAALVVKAARQDPETDVRVAALIALQAFPSHYDAKRTLNDAVSSEDPRLVTAALEALEVVATRDWSSNALMKAVEGKFEMALRERAARLLLRLGDAGGVRLLVKPLKEAADRASRDEAQQRFVADEFKRLGDWVDALDYYERALRALGPRRDNKPYLIEIAKCYARMGNFREARKNLTKAGYKSLRSFAGEQEFQAMKEHPSFRDLFQ
jgi:tetratricopeptide (TPR) repeat protein